MAPFHRTLAPAVAGIALLCAGPGTARAQSESAEESAQTQAKPQETPQPEQPPLPSIETVTKGFERINNNMDKNAPTFFALWRKDNNLIAQIPLKSLDRPWLLSSTFSSGPYWTGFQLGSIMVNWERNDRRLALIQPEVRYIASAGGPNAENVKRSYTGRYILETPIIAEDAGKSIAIDLDDLLTSNGRTLIGWLGSINTSTARIDKAKAFAKNVEIAIRAAWDFWFFKGTLITLHYSLSALPEKTTFEPRRADQRVGFWVHAKRDVSKRDPLRDDFVRIIERWDLKKANPKLRISPPVQPIVFYVEKSVPVEYRRFVRRGIEAWNEAFEAIGFAGAIEVRQQTDTQYANLDPEDVRYNFVRWITTGGAFAIALHRADPRTGQILDGDILIDDAWLDVWVDEYPLLVEQAMRTRLRALETVGTKNNGAARFLRDAATRRGLLLPDPQPDDNDTWRQRLTSAQHRRVVEALRRRQSAGALGAHQDNHLACTYASRLAHSMALAQISWLAAQSADDATTTSEADDNGESESKEPLLDGVPERLIGENLVALTAHEVGHILGLRHNFKASTWKPLSAYDDYRDPSQEPPVASVMDYSSTFIAPPGKEQGLYNMMRVGPYDRWAIAYGYKPVKDKKELDAILAKSIEPAHRFGTDEDVYSPDPTTLLYDAGSDPVEFRSRQFKTIDRLRSELTQRLVKEGENYARVRTAFLRLFFDEWFDLWDMTGWIGGTILNRDANTPGAPPPLVNVDPEQQRRVLELLISRAFSQDSFRFDPDLLNHLQLEKWYYSNYPSWAWWGGGTFNITNQVGLVQYILLSDLFYWGTPRVLEQELRLEPGQAGLSGAELHRRLTDAIWSEFAKAPATDSPTLTPIRRNLQREHVEQLVSLALARWAWTATTRQSQQIATSELRRISARLAPWQTAAVNGRLDDALRVHVQEIALRVNDALEAQIVRWP